MGIENELKARQTARKAISGERAEPEYDREELLEMLEQEMFEAAQKLDFEKAAVARDQIMQLKSVPAYGEATKIKRSSVETTTPKAGSARSNAGMSGRKKKKGRRT
ncbi:MAG: UvrB/UvrC motif-containing protein [Phycisphaerales bacterium]|nr:UvrB/UvrC motif-containing protein [Phycisphaerales bacterium]